MAQDALAWHGGWGSKHPTKRGGIYLLATPKMLVGIPWTSCPAPSLLRMSWDFDTKSTLKFWKRDDTCFSTTLYQGWNSSRPEEGSMYAFMCCSLPLNDKRRTPTSMEERQQQKCLCACVCALKYLMGFIVLIYFQHGIE